MEFVPEPPAKTFSEAMRRRVRSWLERQTNTPEEIFMHEGAVVKQLFKEAEEARGRVHLGWNIEGTTPVPLGKNLRVRVDVMENAGFFMNPWAALLGEKHGKLIRVNEWQHLPYEQDTFWTRNRKARDASSK